MLLKALITSTVLTAIATTTAAQAAGDISVGVGTTNFGFSLEGEYTIAPQIGVRGMLMGAPSFEEEFELEENATLDGEAEFGGIALVGDYYPLSNAWRVSGGLFVSNTEISGLIEDDGISYEGKVEFANTVAPMITTGFSTEFAQGWSVSGDVGVIISSLEASSDSTDPVVQADVDELNDDLEDVPVFPFIGFAISYTY